MKQTKVNGLSKFAAECSHEILVKVRLIGETLPENFRVFLLLHVILCDKLRQVLMKMPEISRGRVAVIVLI